MPITTRPAKRKDTDAMCALLNPIIQEGSTTAYRSPFSTNQMRDLYVEDTRLIRTTLAFEGQDLLGIQKLCWPDPAYDGPGALPEGWAIIATFVHIGAQGKGIGQVLWRDTLLAAKQSGVIAVDATIRADNRPGLAYYTGLGFRDYSTIEGMELSDGTVMDKVQKRFDIA